MGDALAITRGEVRDGVAAIEHFLEVLVSRRVGPKVLVRAVPEVRAGCAPLRAAFGAVERALAVELASDPEGMHAVRELLAHAVGRVDELAGALSHSAGRSSMEARERLALEAIVRRIAGELGTVVRMVDLLGAPVTVDTTSIDFTHALEGRRRPVRPGATVVHAPVELHTCELNVADARVVLELLEFAVVLVARAGGAPWIVLDAGPDGLPRFTVETERRESIVAVGPALDAVMRDELPREAEVVRAAARHAGIVLTIAADRRTVRIAL